MTSNKNKNTNGKPAGKKTSTPRHNFAAMKKVKEARAKSPLTPEEQVRLIREFNSSASARGSSLVVLTPDDIMARIEPRFVSTMSSHYRDLVEYETSRDLL